MNLIPLVSSNLWAARISPRLPSLMRSERETPWFWYFLATETTNRRLERTSLSNRSEEHTSELQSRFGISYAVFCLEKKKAKRRDRPRFISAPTMLAAPSSKKTFTLQQTSFIRQTRTK